MIIDAVVLAGGRSSRLSGTPKAGLVYHGTTLLDLAVQAAIAAGSRTVAVVGTRRPAVTDDRIIVAREEPPFGGPAAGIGAGVSALSRTGAPPSELILVLACDLPEVGRAIVPLLSSLPLPAGTGGRVLTDSDGRQQQLTALYDTAALSAALESRSRHAPLEGLSMRSLVSDLHLELIAAPSGSVDDIDTWADAARHDIAVPPEFAGTTPSEEQ